MPNYNQIYSNNRTSLIYKNKEFDRILQRIDYSDFSNFIYFGSAYQIVYNTIANILNTYPLGLSATTSSDGNLVEKYDTWLNASDEYTQYLIDQFPNKIVITNYDGTTGSYTTIQRSATNQMTQQTDIDYVDALLVDAEEYDNQNNFKFTDFHPKFLYTLDTNQTLENFLNIIGRNFDLAKISADQLANQFHINYTDYNKFAKGNEINFANLLGFNLIDGQFEKTLTQYLLKDGFDSALQLVTENIWNRIINNIPYIYKSKGTLKSIQSLLNCYGITDDLLRIKEYSYALKPIAITADFNSLTATITAIGKFYDSQKVKIESKSEFVKNYNEMGMSFEPIDEINRDIVSSFTSSAMTLDFTSYFADPNIYDGNPYYPDLEEAARIYFENKSFDLNLFIKFVDDFDKGIFDSIKQIIPARTKFTNEGVHIEPHLLQRRRSTNGKLVEYETDHHESEIDLLSFSSTEDYNSSELSLLDIPSQETYNSYKIIDTYEIVFSNTDQYLIIPALSSISYLFDISFELYFDSSNSSDAYIIDFYNGMLPTRLSLYYNNSSGELTLSGVDDSSTNYTISTPVIFDEYKQIRILQNSPTSILFYYDNNLISTMSMTDDLSSKFINYRYFGLKYELDVDGFIGKIKNLDGSYKNSVPFQDISKLNICIDDSLVTSIKNSSISSTQDIIQPTLEYRPYVNILSYRFVNYETSKEIFSASGSYTSLSSFADFSISHNLYHQTDNVLSTTSFSETYVPNFENLQLSNEQKFEYKDNFISETRYLTTLITDSTSANISIDSTFANTNITGITSGVSSSICSVNMKVLSQPMEFAKIKIIIPTSSSGNRLLNIFKGTSYTDTFQTLDCNNSSVSSNLKLNVFYFYTDKDGYIDLLFTNRGIRNGSVPIIFKDEFNYISHTVNITLSGSTESGNYQQTFD